MISCLNLSPFFKSDIENSKILHKTIWIPVLILSGNGLGSLARTLSCDWLNLFNRHDFIQYLDIYKKMTTCKLVKEIWKSKIS